MADGNFQYTSEDDLKRLEREVHKIFIEQGFVTAGNNCCKTVCTISITIGRDSKPIPTINCQLICDN